jgi:phosphoglucosamine mutase (EC 5.4.2.10)
LGFERAWQKLGGQLIRTPVGDQYVHSAMLSSGAMLGGEQSGHILCRHYGISGDGLLTAIHFAKLLKKHTLPVLLADSFATYPQILRNVKVLDREKRLHWQDCQPLLSSIKNAENTLGDRGRVLVRASGTEPVIRVMVEAETHDLAHHWSDRLTAAVQEYL